MNTLFNIFAILALLITAASPVFGVHDLSCTGVCGSDTLQIGTDGNCYCDHWCVYYEDCCDDALEVCPDYLFFNSEGVLGPQPKAEDLNAEGELGPEPSAEKESKVKVSKPKKAKGGMGSRNLRR
jgi:hypothetical protein